MNSKIHNIISALAFAFALLFLMSILCCCESRRIPANGEVASETATETAVSDESETESATETSVEPAIPDQRVVPVLMFHNLDYSGGTWCITPENFRSVIVLVLEHGYTPISFRQLADFAEADGELPPKPIIITLDDGYYSNYYYVLPIVKELEIPVTIFMTCGTVRDDSVTPDLTRMMKMSAAELREMQACEYVEIQSHTFKLHGTNTSYSEIQRDNALPLENESEAEFKAIASEDFEKAEQTLHNIGSYENLAFSYPQGKSCAWTEQVLSARGYKASVTTDFNRLNLVTKGYPDSIRLLGRMNVNDSTTPEKLFAYVDRKGILYSFFVRTFRKIIR